RSGDQPLLEVEDCFRRNCSTSSAEGIEGCAPARVTESAATAEAKIALACTEERRRNPTARPALKASPAAVASTASTAKAGISSFGLDGWAIKQPREPNFSKTFCTPTATSSSADSSRLRF